MNVIEMEADAFQGGTMLLMHRFSVRKCGMEGLICLGVGGVGVVGVRVDGGGGGGGAVL